MNILKTLACTLLLAASSSPVLAGDRTIGESVDDTWIQTRVNAALIGHENHNINVDVHKGEVLLAGFVEEKSTPTEATEIAESIKGVTVVHNHLYQRDTTRMAGETLDDNIIAGKIQAELAGNDKTSAIAIDVEVHEGKALLSGYVGSETEARIAIELAQSIKGVSNVINGMSVISS